MSAAVEELVREGLDRLAAVTEVPPGLAEVALRRTLHERLSGRWLVAPPAVTLIVGLWGVTARPYWGDEIDTVSAVSRSLPQLARLLGHVDAVHGLYYLLLWPVAQVAAVAGRGAARRAGEQGDAGLSALLTVLRLEPCGAPVGSFAPAHQGRPVHSVRRRGGLMP